MTHQQELDEARAEMIFREEQLHANAISPREYFAVMADAYDAARDRYLALLAEDRIRKLAEVQSC